MQASTDAVAVLAYTVVLSYIGQINLAQIAFFGLGAYSLALGPVLIKMRAETTMAFLLLNQRIIKNRSGVKAGVIGPEAPAVFILFDRK